MSSSPKRIFLECTPTYSTDMTTGIQRVVRNIINHADLSQIGNEEVTISPVIYLGKQLYQIPLDCFKNVDEGDDELEQKKYSFAKWLHSLNNNFLLIKIKDRLRAHLLPLFYFIKSVYRRVLAILRSKQLAIQPVSPEQGDVIVFLDVFWGRNHWQDVTRYREKGVRVVFVLYDLIPIQCQKLYGEQIAKEYQQYIDNMLSHSDKILCISESVKHELESYIDELAVIHCQRLPDIDYFHLGANIKNYHGDNETVRDLLIDVFDKSASPVFLMVSTLEPRKNHSYLLDVFEALWKEGLEAKLFIVGRIGWQVDDLVRRIENHPFLSSKLFLFVDLNDAEVSFCYQHSTALVFPSFAEGFGLPVIEALQNGLPVIASDIPVHREIAQDKIMYLDPHNPATLEKLVEQITREGVPKQFIPENFRWMSWQQASEQLLNKLLEAKP